MPLDGNKEWTLTFKDVEVSTDNAGMVIGSIPEEEDVVNHPHHYADACSLECIEVMEYTFGVADLVAFCRCNAFKYMWRYKFKNGEQDLDKARWYINKARELGCPDHGLEELMVKITAKE